MGLWDLQCSKCRNNPISKLHCICCRNNQLHFLSNMANIVGADSTIICFRKEIFEFIYQVCTGHAARIFSNWLECDYNYSKTNPLQNHMLEKHKCLCEHCDKMLKGKAEMREHDTTIHGGIRYPCPEFDCL